MVTVADPVVEPAEVEFVTLELVPLLLVPPDPSSVNAPPFFLVVAADAVVVVLVVKGDAVAPLEETPLELKFMEDVPPEPVIAKLPQ